MHFIEWNKNSLPRQIISYYLVEKPCWQAQQWDVSYSCSSHNSRWILAHFCLSFHCSLSFWLPLRNWKLQLPPPDIYCVEVWRLTRPLRDLNMLLGEPLLCCSGSLFWVVGVMLEDPWARLKERRFNIFNIQYFQCISLCSLALSAVMSPCTLCTRTTPKHDFSTSKLDCENGDLIIILIFFSILWKWLVELRPNSLNLVSTDHSSFPKTKLDDPWRVEGSRRKI